MSKVIGKRWQNGEQRSYISLYEAVGRNVGTHFEEFSFVGMFTLDVFFSLLV